MAEISRSGIEVWAAIEESTETGTYARSQLRTQTIFDIFYDDEEGEPSQAIEDSLTDLMHMAAERGVDFEQALSNAARMWTNEREEWEIE